jgi:hypothetical protein
MDVKIYTTNNTTYLGTLTKKTISGIQVRNVTATPDMFADYLKAGVMGELLEVKLGKNSSLVCRELTRREKLDLNIVIAEMREAEALSKDWLVAKVFDEFRAAKK